MAHRNLTFRTLLFPERWIAPCQTKKLMLKSDPSPPCNCWVLHIICLPNLTTHIGLVNVLLLLTNFSFLLPTFQLEFKTYKCLMNIYLGKVYMHMNFCTDSTVSSRNVDPINSLDISALSTTLILKFVDVSWIWILFTVLFIDMRDYSVLYIIIIKWIMLLIK